MKWATLTIGMRHAQLHCLRVGIFVTRAPLGECSDNVSSREASSLHVEIHALATPTARVGLEGRSYEHATSSVRIESLIEFDNYFELRVWLSGNEAAAESSSILFRTLCMGIAVLLDRTAIWSPDRNSDPVVVPHDVGRRRCCGRVVNFEQELALT